MSQYILIKLYVPELGKSKEFGVEVLESEGMMLPVKPTGTQLAKFKVANVKYHELNGQVSTMKIMFTHRDDSPRCPRVAYYRRKPVYFGVLHGFPQFLKKKRL